MRTLARRTFATLSLILLLATVAAWGRCRWAFERVTWVTVRDGGDVVRQRDVEFRLFRNALAIEVYTTRSEVAPGPGGERFRRSVPSAAGVTRVTGDPESLVPLDDPNLHFGFACWVYPPHGERRTGWPGPVERPMWTVSWNRQYVACVPWWFLTLLFAIAPALAVRRWHKARRRKPHQCAACGYDCRATADPAGPRLTTCPECGHPFPPAAGGANA